MRASRSQRERILSLYPDEGGLSMAVLAILWIGGALVFLGVAFLLSMLWEELGAVRGLIIAGLDGLFFAAGALLRRRPALVRTATALRLSRRMR